MHPVERFINDLRERAIVAAARAEADMLTRKGERTSDLVFPSLIEIPAAPPRYS